MENSSVHISIFAASARRPFLRAIHAAKFAYTACSSFERYGTASRRNTLFSDPITFREIARLAEELKISNGISSTLREWDDMIKAQTLAREAFHASAAVTLPDLALDQPGYSLPTWLNWLSHRHRRRINKQSAS